MSWLSSLTSIASGVVVGVGTGLLTGGNVYAGVSAGIATTGAVNSMFDSASSKKEAKSQEEINQDNLDLQIDNFNLGIDNNINDMKSAQSDLINTNKSLGLEIDSNKSNIASLETYFNRFSDERDLAIASAQSTGKNNFNTLANNYGNSLTLASGMGHIGGSSQVASNVQRSLLSDYAGSDLSLKDTNSSIKNDDGTTGTYVSFSVADGIYGQSIKSLLNDTTAEYQTSLNSKFDLESAVKSLQDTIAKNTGTITDYDKEIKKYEEKKIEV